MMSIKFGETFFDRGEFREKIYSEITKNEFLAVISINMFTMEGCPPCKMVKEMLFGSNEEYSIWKVMINRVQNSLAEKVQMIIERLLEKFQQEKNLTNLSKIFSYVNFSNGSRQDQMDKLVKFVLNNFLIVFSEVNNQTESRTVEMFGIRAFPSFVVCLDSKMFTADHKKPIIPLRAGSFASINDFNNYLNIVIEKSLEVYCETLLAAWIIKQSENY
jgi:thiol-disulfide isomerase/thioredoxin